MVQYKVVCRVDRKYNAVRGCRKCPYLLNVVGDIGARPYEYELARSLRLGGQNGDVLLLQPLKSNFKLIYLVF